MIHQKIRHDPATALIRAVLTLAQGEAALEEHRGTSWASATFTGMRHVMRVSLSGDEGIRIGEWLAQVLPEHEFRISGHLVADIAVSAVHRRVEGTPAMTLTIEALTVEAD
ncbi:MAG: hypothetical protein A2792_17300 [Sphingomonadales bacterium RIFCSPHIGHO2_01_FULL_65_20]|jgi:hypothetical protein|uniref:Uncharacterized protein n=1 Tax=Sphingomonas ursincola TaxID=56361 RepID=A0A7V8RAV6_9SPHN|nr:hypothetical protein [Sphingomonas ursincola]MBA4778885.1 hypothetical protein [Blastomonas sp.]OHC92507.1 MAG: hypothetical protein A2792_17300 [Sphingomonadales bacterium RIFCSPHIGHO2_01_FULL_65_20]MBA1373061.1 hypothetical protein [Sphingomonas ursincola]MBY0618304.1 hypothetical protein [Sphingomonas ursincola]MCH2237067.1 hypothetical protein [Blastomonas sp.]